MTATTERGARRRAVRAIRETISLRKDLVYEHKDLEHYAPIQILPMPLSSDGDPLFQSEFFEPFRKPLPDPDEEIEFCPTSLDKVDYPMTEALTVGHYFQSYIWDGVYSARAGEHNSPMQYVIMTVSPAHANLLPVPSRMPADHLVPDLLISHTAPSWSLKLRTPLTGVPVVSLILQEAPG